MGDWEELVAHLLTPEEREARSKRYSAYALASAERYRPRNDWRLSTGSTDEYRDGLGRRKSRPVITIAPSRDLL